MAGAAVLRISALASASPLKRPSLHHPTTHSLSLPLLQWKNPRVTMCHAKYDGSIGEAAERMYRMSFEGNELVEEEEEEEDSDEDEESESSIDLLIRFVQSMFKKVSKRARKATRSVLPPNVFSPQLVSFAVDGVLILASLSILKAFLEVVCTLGGAVFVAILLSRALWSAVSYFQSTDSGYNNGGSYGRTQPAA